MGMFFPFGPYFAIYRHIVREICQPLPREIIPLSRFVDLLRRKTPLAAEDGNVFSFRPVLRDLSAHRSRDLSAIAARDNSPVALRRSAASKNPTRRRGWECFFLSARTSRSIGTSFARFVSHCRAR